ncbi:MAG TPA: glycosyltransferase family 4 protein [Rubrivivax sp.]|nr:glycosyltransferase family 4 protein [Rubrivivax sp.]
MPQPLSITIVAAALDLSGGARVIATYADLLAEDGHHVTVVSVGPQAVSWREAVKDLLKTGRWPRRSKRSDKSHYDGSLASVRVLDAYRPITDADLPDADVVIATWWETAEWVARLSPSKGAKVYLVQHHEIFDYMPIDRVRATYRLPLHKVVVAPWLRDVMQSEYQDHDVDLVLNAVDHHLFNAPPRAKQPQPTVGVMYSQAGFKALHVAIEALREIKRQVPAVRLVAFGVSQAQGFDFMGSDMEFHLRPSQQVIRDCYRRVDVWLSSSRSEGFNLPSLEAMACRTPVVATRTGWPATAIRDGENGYLADVDDSRALAAGVVKVLRTTPPQWGAFSEAAAQTASPLTWQQAYPLFLASLRKAMAKQKDRHGLAEVTRFGVECRTALSARR